MNLKSYVLALLFLVITGCYAPGNYEVIRPGLGKNGTHVIMKMSKEHPFIVIQEGDSSWQLVNYRLNRENSSISGTLKKLPLNRTIYSVVDTISEKRTVEGNTVPFDEQHILVSKLIIDSSGQVLILNEAITEIQLYNKIYKLRKGIAIPVFVAISTFTTVIIVYGFVEFFESLDNFNIHL